MKPASVWTLTKTEWNPRTQFDHACLDLPLTRNLITRVLTICHAKLMQSTALEQKRFDLRSLSPGRRNLWLLLYITLASHVVSQHSFGIPVRMYGMHRTQFDHACLELSSLVIWSSVFLNIGHMKLTQSTTPEQKRFDLRLLSPALRNLWLPLVARAGESILITEKQFFYPLISGNLQLWCKILEHRSSQIPRKWEDRIRQQRNQVGNLP